MSTDPISRRLADALGAIRRDDVSAAKTAIRGALADIGIELPDSDEMHPAAVAQLIAAKQFALEVECLGGDVAGCEAEVARVVVERRTTFEDARRNVLRRLGVGANE